MANMNPNRKGLKPPFGKNPETASIASKGGKASQKVQKEKRELKESLLLLLSTSNGQDSLCTALFEKALTGDVRAFECIRDTIGQKPVEKKELTGKDGQPLNPPTIIINPVGDE